MNGQIEGLFGNLKMRMMCKCSSKSKSLVSSSNQFRLSQLFTFIFGALYIYSLFMYLGLINDESFDNAFVAKVWLYERMVLRLVEVVVLEISKWQWPQLT